MVHELNILKGRFLNVFPFYIKNKKLNLDSFFWLIVQENLMTRRISTISCFRGFIRKKGRFKRSAASIAKIKISIESIKDFL